MAKKGKKFYSETENGGVIFHTERRIGDVRIPNYVYDMWLAQEAARGGTCITAL